MSSSAPDLITTRQAAERIGHSIRYIIRRVDSGELTPVHKLPGLRGAYLFDPADVDVLLEQLEEAS